MEIEKQPKMGDAVTVKFHAETDPFDAVIVDIGDDYETVAVKVGDRDGGEVFRVKPEQVTAVRDIHAGDFAPATTAEAIAVAGECDCDVRNLSDATQLGVKRSMHYAGEIENDAFRCSWYRPAPVVDHSKLTHRR